ncbi:MAG: hypothetical protein O3B24_08240 [Verrucomicrobia bacterium]|nr:hypothetical protein [Verrucomicrobiota bacterium]
MDSSKTSLRPGITWRSLCAMLFCMLLLGMGIQYAEIIQSHGYAPAEQSVSIPAVLIIVLVLLLSGVFALLTRARLLTRPELLCSFYAMLIAAPLMTQGMWHRFFGIIVATPREGNFAYIDAVSDKLWPHGPNLLEGGLNAEGDHGADVRGSVSWREIEVEPGLTISAPVMQNRQPGDVSSISMRIPVAADGHEGVRPGDPYLISVLARPSGLGPDSFYFMRLQEDDAATFRELLNERKSAEVTYLHQRGFMRLGKYGVDVSSRLRDSLRVEIGLSGPGELIVHDPKLLSVAAIEGAFRGRRIIDEAAFASLPLGERTGLIVKPGNMWSLAGFKFLVMGYIPVTDWTETAVAWSTPILLLLVGLFAVAVLMRRQWADHERYAFPLARIPCAIIGEPDEDDTRVWSSIWRNRIMWIGFAVALLWGLLRMWAFYNAKVPDTLVRIDLSQYLSDAGWGQMWRVRFSVSALVVSLCIFFELNVLLSFVLGFLLFRALFWVGAFSGLTVYTGYPFRYEQAVGAYLAYAIVVAFFTRRYLWGVLVAACRRGGGVRPPDAPMSNRTALVVLALVHVGIVIWADWLGVPKWGVLAYFCFLTMVGFVATKLRCECGVPTGYFTPYNAMLFVSLLGGMTVFGPSGLMLCLMASGFLTVSVFFFIPGTQLELIEFGRRYRMNPRHVMIAVLLGIAGGLFIGGWVFLSNAYALGGNAIRYQWAFNQGWFFGAFKTQLAQTTSEFLRVQAGEAATGGIPSQTWGYVYGGVITFILAVCRQLFAGFWFHPIGFILGSAHMLEWTWGSVFTAWAIRAVVLKFGGATTVKNKLFPLFVGVFLGSSFFLLLNVSYAGYLQSMGVERIFSVLP